MSSVRRWEFSKLVPPSRRQYLSDAPTLKHLTEQIISTMRVLCAHSSTCHDNTDFSRAVFSIEIPTKLFDLLFNSVNGYRAWYFRSPYEGLRANFYLISSVADSVLSTHWGTCMGTRAADSLHAMSAKLWLSEDGNKPCNNCNECKGEWKPPQDSAPEILNGRWEHGSEWRERYGRKAPVLSKLRVFGGFLDAAGNEFVPQRKRARAREIHDFGWS